MQTLKEWINSDKVQQMIKMSDEEILNKYFLRKPQLLDVYDPKYFYSPASGTVISVHSNIAPNSSIVEVKGKNYTVRRLLEDDNFNYHVLLVSIFMSFYDVHVQTVPYSGNFSVYNEKPILSKNYPMLATEEKIMEDIVDTSTMDYLFENERKITYVTNGDINYFVTQIADERVNMIENISNGKYMKTGQEFGIIKEGSQVDFLIVLNDKMKYKILVNEKDHVESGFDKIVEIL